MAMLERLRERKLIEELRHQPETIFTRAGLNPDPWQTRLLRSTSPRKLLCCCRQSGKSTTAAALVLKTALLQPKSLCLLLAPVQRQSGELFRQKVIPMWRALGSPLKGRDHTQTEMQLANGSRIISLPGEGETIRGYSSVALLVIDEAAYVKDEYYFSVRPMLAVSGGSLIGLSSAYAQLGWFYNEWTGQDEWERVKVTADQCPRISKDFLDNERRTLGERWYDMEYNCVFGESVGAVFRQQDIDAALANDVEPLFA